MLRCFAKTKYLGPSLSNPACGEKDLVKTSDVEQKIQKLTTQLTSLLTKTPLQKTNTKAKQ
jgi:hypothetical protein